MGRQRLSVVRRHLKWSALLQLVIVAAATAQSATSDHAKGVERADCASVVIIKCDRPAPEIQLGTPDEQRQQSRRNEPRRQSLMVQQLEGVVVEGEALRRRSIEDMMNIALPPVRARDGNYTIETGEGTKCSCMNVCPPWPLPCCTCSGHMNRYRSMPGSSPIN